MARIGGGMTQAADTLEDGAAALCRLAGRAAPVRIQRLGGGRNNQVHRIEGTDGRRTVMKLYFRHGEDERDRLGHEWSFVSYAWRAGLRTIAEPLAMDRALGAALFSELPGRPCSGTDVTEAAVVQAAAFLRALNADHEAIAALPVASEACFSLAAHIATVEGRLARLAAIDSADAQYVGARHFILHELLPRWRAVESSVRARAGGLGIGMDTPLADTAVILSPSDFGFHNALIDGDRIAFVDFEYAGRDDPAKLIGDFFNQVERPVPLRYLPLMIEAAVADERAAARARLLLPVFAVKWTAILLNDFLPAGAARRHFALAGAPADRLAGQLAAARAKLANVEVMLDA